MLERQLHRCSALALRRWQMFALVGSSLAGGEMVPRVAGDETHGACWIWFEIDGIRGREWHWQWRVASLTETAEVSQTQSWH